MKLSSATIAAHTFGLWPGFTSGDGRLTVGIRRFTTLQQAQEWLVSAGQDILDDDPDFDVPRYHVVMCADCDEEKAQDWMRLVNEGARCPASYRMSTDSVVVCLQVTDVPLTLARAREVAAKELSRGRGRTNPQWAEYVRVMRRP